MHSLPSNLENSPRLRGYSVLPTPRQIRLNDKNIHLDSKIVIQGEDSHQLASTQLRSILSKNIPIQDPSGSNGVSHISLSITSDAVHTGREEQVHNQGYRIVLTPNRINLVGNSAAGLFYAVQTLAQLIDSSPTPGILPMGEIIDWPEHSLRVIHWDTKHHQDRLETLRRYLDWLAYFKVNAVSFELEDKFEYPSHPIIGAPNAFTTSELQELTGYALARHIQLIPNIQAPAHMAYVLKHKEFEHLKCDGSNYMICMENPEARKLIFDMYDDVCDATPGIQYLHVSTDEVYYAGICQQYRAPYNPENRSLTLVDFLKAAHAHLTAKGRRIIFWDENPLFPQHISLLPKDLIGGIVQTDEIAEANKTHGLEMLAYHPIQGSEHVFPRYFRWADDEGNPTPGRISSAWEKIVRGRAANAGRVIGNFAASWDDSGLHNETFWLGWATMAQLGWMPAQADAEQTTAEFLTLYLGSEVTGELSLAYLQLHHLAEFWRKAWDKVPSRLRPSGYGNSTGKKPCPRTDLTLTLPTLPSLAEFKIDPSVSFNHRYAHLIEEARRALQIADELMARLHAAIPKTSQNRYHLEVLMTLGKYTRHHAELITSLAEAQSALITASKFHSANNFKKAMDQMISAMEIAHQITTARHFLLTELKATWEKSRLPRGASQNGRDFLHIMDDVKDHFADRRKDLTYLTAPEEELGLEKWITTLGDLIRQYAAAHKLTVKSLPDPVLED
jgi:hexosaminidase